jgi:hypothetical protein
VINFAAHLVHNPLHGRPVHSGVVLASVCMGRGLILDAWMIIWYAER